MRCRPATPWLQALSYRPATCSNITSGIKIFYRGYAERSGFEQSTLDPGEEIPRSYVTHQAGNHGDYFPTFFGHGFFSAVDKRSVFTATGAHFVDIGVAGIQAVDIRIMDIRAQRFCGRVAASCLPAVRPPRRFFIAYERAAPYLYGMARTVCGVRHGVYACGGSGLHAIRYLRKL